MRTSALLLVGGSLLLGCPRTPPPADQPARTVAPTEAEAPAVAAMSGAPDAGVADAAAPDAAPPPPAPPPSDGVVLLYRHGDRATAVWCGAPGRATDLRDDCLRWIDPAEPAVDLAGKAVTLGALDTWACPKTGGDQPALIVTSPSAGGKPVETALLWPQRRAGGLVRWKPSSRIPAAVKKRRAAFDRALDGMTGWVTDYGPSADLRLTRYLGSLRIDLDADGKLDTVHSAVGSDGKAYKLDGIIAELSTRRSEVIGLDMTFNPDYRAVAGFDFDGDGVTEMITELRADNVYELAVGRWVAETADREASYQRVAEHGCEKDED